MESAARARVLSGAIPLVFNCATTEVGVLVFTESGEQGAEVGEDGGLYTGLLEWYSTGWRYYAIIALVSSIGLSWGRFRILYI